MKSTSGRGGSRPGAGRPKGARNKVARELKDMLAPADQKAVKRLIDIIDRGPPKAALEAIRLSWEYRHGKPKRVYGEQDDPVGRNVIVVGGGEQEYIAALRKTRECVYGRENLRGPDAGSESSDGRGVLK